MAAESSTSNRDADLCCLGVITGSRGLRGEVRIKSFTADPVDVASYGPLVDESGRQSFRISVTGHARGQVLAKIEGVKDRDGADALKGQKLHVARSQFPEAGTDEYYHRDLIGLRAELTNGECLGLVKAVYDFGAGEMLEIEKPDKKEILLPFTRAVVPEIDLHGGRIVVDTPEGLFDDPSEADAMDRMMDENKG